MSSITYSILTQATFTPNGNPITVNFYYDDKAPDALLYNSPPFSQPTLSLTQGDWNHFIITSTPPAGVSTPPLTTIDLSWNVAARTIDAHYTFTNAVSAVIAVTNTVFVPSATLVSSPSGSTISASGSSVTGSSSSTSTASSSATNSPKSTQTGSGVKDVSKGVSKGGAAGLAVGCFVAGAFIAGLLFLLFRKRRKGQPRKDREAGAVAFLPREKHADSNVQSVGSNSPISSIVDAHLPQPLEDNAISGEINKIGNLIKNHVQSYYHSNRVGAGAADFEAFQTLGDSLPISPGTLGALLANPNTREVALRFYIARVVLARSKFDSDPSISFLPPEVAACVRSMSSFNNSAQVRSAFLSKWRSVTAELLQATYARNPFSTADSRNGNISNALEELDSILRLYTDSRNDNTHRRRNLEEILKRVATFAFTLFSQPSLWNLDWQDEKGTEPGSLVIFPALVQLSDETGQPLRHPRPLSEPTVRRIDG